MTLLNPPAVIVVLLAGSVFNTASAGDRELGQYLSAECVACHQASGTAAAGVPSIVGWPESQFVAVMNAYKNKQRDNPVMQTVAGRLAADDIAALASYFGGLSPTTK
ncbi:c-type cytochrome [Bradyrhizobium sp. SYSU BS000235]|uniref:c-type cytochrome n=1 Tax=Bradyrhizobium sp. SYSU BS000235 TaxID=3411332 RepID=UPI003C7693AC